MKPFFLFFFLFIISLDIQAQDTILNRIDTIVRNSYNIEAINPSFFEKSSDTITIQEVSNLSAKNRDTIQLLKSYIFHITQNIIIDLQKFEYQQEKTEYKSIKNYNIDTAKFSTKLPLSLPIQNTISNNNFINIANLDSSIFIDLRDGKKYKIVKVGKQTWFAQNLNYETSNCWCYDNDTSNCTKYGRLYDWKSALQACPKGWHLPSDLEWKELIDFLGGYKISGSKLRNTKDWKTSTKIGTNTNDFSALPAGYRDYEGNFIYVGSYAYWWTSNIFDTGSSWMVYTSYNTTSVDRFNFAKPNGLSCRCVKD